MNVYMLLDRSGSMNTRWDETISALNQYIFDLAKEMGGTKVTIAAFDSPQPNPSFQNIFGGKPFTPMKMDDGYVELRRNAAAEGYMPLAATEIRPRGMTALFDAVGRITNQMLQDNPERAVLVILTDGAENSSKEWKKDRIKTRLDEIKAKGWQVAFIGADFDAFTDGAVMGVAAASTINTVQGSYGNTMRSMARETKAYGVTGQSMNFTEEDRAQAKGQQINGQANSRRTNDPA